MFGMKKMLASVFVSVGLLSSAYAGAYSDKLQQCALGKVTTEDRGVAAKWIFSILADHPAVVELSGMTTAQKQQYDKEFVDLLMRLLIEDCKQEFKDTINYEGIAAMVSAFESVGMVLGGQIMADPAIEKRLENFTQLVDEEKIQKALE